MIPVKFAKLFLISCALLFSGCFESPVKQGDTFSDQFLFSVAMLDAWFLFRENIPENISSFYNDPVSLYNSLNEPHTYFLDPDLAKWFYYVALSTSSVDIGIHTDSTSLGYVVKSVFQNSAAYISGIHKLDTITTVNGVSLQNVPRSQATQMLSGTPGTTKILQVKRLDDSLNITVELVEYMRPSVITDSLSESTIYVLISNFFSRTSHDRGTAAEFREALQSAPWAVNVILDLRSNGGGELSQCFSVISELLPPGTEIITRKERYYDEQRDNFNTKEYVWKTDDGGDFLNKRLCILLDKGTASASEILVSGLIDNRDDVFTMGKSTYGKARGQRFGFGPDSCMAVVTFMKLTPVRGLEFDEEIGIEPKLIVNEDENIIQRAFEHFEGTTLARRKKADFERVENLFASFSSKLEVPMAFIEK